MWRDLPDTALYLDDRREPLLDTWTWVQTVAAAKTAIIAAVPEFLSVDYDLGATDTATGEDLVRWIAQTGQWPTGMLQVHSGSTEGREKISAVVAASGLFAAPEDHPLGPLFVRSTAPQS